MLQVYIRVSCFRWREVQLLPLLNSKSSSSSPPAKSLKLDSRQNEVFFTSGDEPIPGSSSATDHTGVNQDESLDACSQDESEVLLQLFVI